ncbi:3'(2'),5'-bisphosphate nucleotidase CysQ [bacterium]|nr:3'(2'),5'-bisphosphate nucleotidase CysQ [bacterium]
MTEQLNLALRAAAQAAQAILEVYASADFETETKGDNSPLTLADRRSHLAIQPVLNESDIPVLSEEGRSIPYAERAPWTWLWVVDPLDGTKEFIKRNGEFTVNIALINGQDPVAGVVWVPVTGEVYAGWVGHGAYKMTLAPGESVEWDRLKTEGLPLPQTFDRPFTAVGSRSHMSPETEVYFRELEAEHGTVNVLSKGSSLKLCMVAEGLADVYPRFAPTMEWDTAAGHAVCTAAGFRVLRWPEKTPVKYNKEDLLNPWFWVGR